MYKKPIILMFCLLSSLVVNAQNETQLKIASTLKDYFALGRENIHLHLNKDTYLTNEKIWFKGYIIDKKSRSLNISTKNAYINLRDGSGNIIATNLQYCEKGMFGGNVAIPEDLKSGKYYMQVYTHHMNNFFEDESAIFPITILNIGDNKQVDYSAVNWKDIQISIFPESGTFLEGVNNTVGIRITDCNGNGIEAEGVVTDPVGNRATTFSTNIYGYGRFEIIGTKNGIYKASFEKNGLSFEQELPNPVLSGISFSVNSYGVADKVIINVKTNQRSLNEVANRPYTFAIHQNDAVAFVEFEFAANKLEQTFAVSSDYLSSGINTIRLLDNDLKQQGERLVFKPFKTAPKTEIKTNSRIDSLVIKGNSPMPLASLSISVLPSNTASKYQSSIYDSFYFGNYTDPAIQNFQYYLTNFNRKKHYELDNALLGVNSKYRWNQILSGAPQEKFPAENGLTVKGTVSSPVADTEKAIVSMWSAEGNVRGHARMNAKKEFVIENVIATDSSTLNFAVFDVKKQQAKLTMYTRISGPAGKFLKSFPRLTTECSSAGENFVDADWPVIQGAIHLEDVKVISKDKTVQLNPENVRLHSNSMARGYKITPEEAGGFRDVLQWLAAHGFNVSTMGGTVSLTRNYSATLMGNNSPAVFIDDSPIPQLDILLNMNLDMIDEIYINRRGYGAGSMGANGVIRIYTTKGKSGNAARPNYDVQTLVVKNGYQTSQPYKNPAYSDVTSPSFLKYGNIGWEYNVETDQEGKFEFAIPNLYQENVRVIIEGMSGDGSIYSEQLNIQLPTR